MKYIDVSFYQGNVDWDKVNGNVDGVILRAGYGQNHIDKKFVEYVKACNRLDIPCGAYWFSYARSVQMAEQEAAYLLGAVAPYRMELPLAFDYEDDSVKNSVLNGVTPTPQLVRDMATAFLSRVEAGGYYGMLYTNGSFISKYYGTEILKRYDLWYAQWPKTVNVAKPPRRCGIWQWGGSAVPGISGDVDTNEAYNDYAKIIREAKLNHLVDRPWYYEAMKWAKTNGIIEDERPLATATRAEVVQMLHNYSQRYCGPRYSGLIDE